MKFLYINSIEDYFLFTIYVEEIMMMESKALVLKNN